GSSEFPLSHCVFHKTATCSIIHIRHHFKTQTGSGCAYIKKKSVLQNCLLRKIHQYYGICFKPLEFSTSCKTATSIRSEGRIVSHEAVPFRFKRQNYNVLNPGFLQFIYYAIHNFYLRN